MISARAIENMIRLISEEGTVKEAPLPHMQIHLSLPTESPSCVFLPLKAILDDQLSIFQIKGLRHEIATYCPLILG